MPNHVHVLISLHKDFSLGSLLHSWKSFTANQANQLLGRSGSFWQREYYDRAIRSERQFEFTVRYIFNNPVKAGLCKEVYQWPWSGCSEEILPKIKQFFLV
jgi:REP element-mobilizing transposase RayT